MDRRYPQSTRELKIRATSRALCEPEGHPAACLRATTKSLTKFLELTPIGHSQQNRGVDGDDQMFRPRAFEQFPPVAQHTHIMPCERLHHKRAASAVLGIARLLTGEQQPRTGPALANNRLCRRLEIPVPVPRFSR